MHLQLQEYRADVLGGKHLFIRFAQDEVKTSSGRTRRLLRHIRNRQYMGLDQVTTPVLHGGGFYHPGRKPEVSAGLSRPSDTRCEKILWYQTNVQFPCRSDAAFELNCAG
jgi:hypothetical protein